MSNKEQKVYRITVESGILDNRYHILADNLEKAIEKFKSSKEITEEDKKEMKRIELVAIINIK